MSFFKREYKEDGTYLDVPLNTAELVAIQSKEAERPKRAAREEIEKQEDRQSTRTMREAILGDAQAIARLQDIDNKIKTQRAIIQGS